jgi:hypothetical protein
MFQKQIELCKSRFAKVALPRKTRLCSCWASAATRTAAGYGSLAKSFGELTTSFSKTPAMLSAKRKA